MRVSEVILTILCLLMMCAMSILLLPMYIILHRKYSRLKCRGCPLYEMCFDVVCFE